MLEEPTLVDPYTKLTINRLNKAINVIYIIEAILKITAMGFVLEKNSYLRDSFNVFDFIIICVSIISMILEDLAEKTNI
jgi:cytochrome c oxidase subunit IV